MAKRCSECGLNVGDFVPACPVCGANEFEAIRKPIVPLLGRGAAVAILLAVAWWLYFRK